MLLLVEIKASLMATLRELRLELAKRFESSVVSDEFDVSLCQPVNKNSHSWIE